MFTLEDYERFLSLAPTSVLEQVGALMILEADNVPKNSADFEALTAMIQMLGLEYQQRQMEPLWRKAQRFALRNSATLKQVGQVAASIGAGVVLGVSLDN